MPHYGNFDAKRTVPSTSIERFMEQTMGGLVFRGVGMVRAAAAVALTNLVYNMCRFTQIVRYHANWIKPENVSLMG